jgi:hypothetical protein
VSLLARRLIEIHDALSRAKLAHAFGGAIALAYCTEEPRGTRDVDVNVFVAPGRAKEVLGALPDGMTTTVAAARALEEEGQARLWWDDTPIDIFLDIHSFHEEVARGVRLVPFEARTIPVLNCTALTVFKALFNRTKDWADIEEMASAGSLDLQRAVASVERMVGSDDPSLSRLASLAD